jgi:flagellar hook-length control protein FliK
VVQQLANGDRSLTLRLTPPSLGTVRIELIEHRGVISVRFAAEDDGVRQAIERQLPQIRQDLRAADAPIAQVQLDEQAGAFHQDRSDDQPGQQAQNEQRQSARDGQPTFDLDGGFADEPEDEALVSTPSLGGTVNDDAVDARA